LVPGQVLNGYKTVGFVVVYHTKRVGARGSEGVAGAGRHDGQGGEGRSRGGHLFLPGAGVFFGMIERTRQNLSALEGNRS